VDRDANLKFFVRLDLLEVDVEEAIRDRIALDFLEEGERLVALVGDLELDEDGAITDGLQQAGELRSFDRERLGFRMLPVENRWNTIGLAEPAGGAAARLGTRGDVKFEVLSHDFVPPVTPELEAGVMEKRVR
jgi:hypothetical protein